MTENDADLPATEDQAASLAQAILDGVTAAVRAHPTVKPATVLRAMTMALVSLVPQLFVREGWSLAFRLVGKDMLIAAQRIDLMDSEPEGGVN